MIDLDTWQEIISTVRRNKLRTFLTAAGVFWGIFMLIVMLGAGNGLRKGVTKSMRGFASNAVYVWGQRTSVPYKGMKPGRRVRYRNDDIEAIAAEIPQIEHLAPRVQLGGYRSGNNVIYNGRTGNFGVMGDFPQIWYIQSLAMVHGRFINDLDLQQKRKVAVIGKMVYRDLFRGGKDPVGEYIRINGVYFQVVGTFESKQTGEQGDRQGSTVYVPFSAFQQVFNTGPFVQWFAITAKKNSSAAEVERRVRTLLAERHKVSPEDHTGIGSYNVEKEFRKVQGLFGGIRMIVWFVGIVTMLAGVIGVSNIMLIVVKERTREIGVRKAMGATPGSVIGMIMQESVVLTIMAGYTGLVAGVGGLELVGLFVGDSTGMFRKPEVDLQVALIAAGVLVVAGAIAGVIPAQRAVRIRPVEALRGE